MTEQNQSVSAKNTHWPRTEVRWEEWQTAAQNMADGSYSLVAHWAEPNLVHAALRDPGNGQTGIISVAVQDGHYPALGRYHAPAIRLERAIADLTGLVPDGAPDTRPWLDHGNWSGSAATAREPYAFLTAQGESLHQIPVGPVHAGIIEPGHFRFTCNGETIVRLEARLGYMHRGCAALMVGAPIAQGATLATRVSGDSTVAYGLAFAQSVEAALGCTVPPRAAHLRAVMLEWERIANHFGDVGAICNDAAFPLMLTHCGILREQALRLAANVFGHRLMMDCVVPGGVATDIGADAIEKIRHGIAAFKKRLPAIVALYEDTASLQDRTVRTGIVRQSLAEQFGAGGPIGRASNRDFDARKALPFAPYDQLDFQVPLLFRGDVDARIRIRLSEIAQSLSLIEHLLTTLPGGEVRCPLPAGAGEGAALVEGFRGDIFVFLRINPDGTIAHCHVRDPSWFQWPLLEAAIEGNIVADFPLCNKSFNCSYAGPDL